MTLISETVGKINKAMGILTGVVDYNVSGNFAPLPPKGVLLAITYKCDSRCVMCNIWKMKPKNELTLKEWQRVLKDPVFKTIEDCSLTGGELSLNSNLLEIVETIISEMPKLKKISLTSNGFATQLIVKRVTELAKICNRNNINLSVGISIDGVGKMHEKIRRIPNAFEKATKTLFELKKLSKKYKFWVGSYSLILRQNLSEVEKMEKWYKKNNVAGSFQIVGFHDTYVDNLDTKDKVSFRKEERRQLESFMKERSKPKSWRDFKSYYWRDLLSMYRDKKPRTTPCPFQKDQFAVDSFGDVYNCFSSPKIGNCRKGESIGKILFSKKNLLFKKQMLNSSCLKCNSGCNVEWSVSRDLKKYLWFRITGKPWYGFNKNKKIR